MRSAPSFPPYLLDRALLTKPEAAKRRSWGETAQDNREPGKLALPGPQLGRLRGGYRLPLLLLRLLRRLGGLAKLNPCEFSRNVFSRRATPPGLSRGRTPRESPRQCGPTSTGTEPGQPPPLRMPRSAS